MSTFAEFCTSIVGKVLLALVVWFVGKFAIKKVLGLMDKGI